LIRKGPLTNLNEIFICNIQSAPLFPINTIVFILVVYTFIYPSICKTIKTTCWSPLLTVGYILFIMELVRCLACKISITIAHMLSFQYHVTMVYNKAILWCKRHRLTVGKCVRRSLIKRLSNLKFDKNIKKIVNYRGFNLHRYC
jgi:hypothetical protein